MSILCGLRGLDGARGARSLMRWAMSLKACRRLPRCPGAADPARTSGRRPVRPVPHGRCRTRSRRSPPRPPPASSVRGGRSARSMPWRRATSMAPWAMRSAGCVPADVEGISLTCCQSAAASWDRGAVPCADKQDAAGAVFDPRHQALQGAGGKPDVAAAPVRFGAAPGRQPGLFQRAQVVGEQIRRHPQLCLQLRRGEVPQGQQVNDAQPRRIGEGRMLGYPRPKVVNCINIH